MTSTADSATELPAAHQRTDDLVVVADEVTGAVSKTVRSPEIEAALDRYDITAATLTERLLNERQKLGAEALSGFDRAHEAEETLERAKGAADAVRGATSGVLSGGVVITTLALAAVIVQSIVAAIIGRRSLPATLADAIGEGAAVGALAVLVAVWIGLVTLSSRRDRRAAESVGLAGREAEVDEAWAAARKELYEGVVLPRAREVIEELRNAPFSRRLGFTSAPGLSQVFSLDYEVPTAAMADLAASMTAMSGGSIGLAGPRGAGKSVLMRSFASGHQQLAGRPDTIGVVVDAPVRYDTREFVLHLFERICRQAGAEDTVAAAATPSLLGPVLRASRLRRLAAPRRYSTPAARLAGDHLDVIQFERTVTVGGGVAFDARVARASGDVKTQMARVPWGVPQLIATLRGFLEVLARDYVVIIGIDELDKLESSEDARKFVNDIKGIFGVGNCFFLVSISEDAMSSFERRGQPLRDVFDSAFDHVHRVPPLTHAECERMLRRRVIGMGPPFVAACTAMSGGVPRDVIRFGRRLMLTAAGADTDMRPLLIEVLAAEAAAKARAGLVVAARHSDVEVSADVVRWLREVEAGAPLGSACDDYFSRVRKILQPDNDDDADLAAGRRELRALAAETVTWLYHADTVGQLFGGDYDEALHRTLTADGTIDRLAAARHDMAFGARASWSATSAVREQLGIPTLMWPSAG